MIDVFLNAVLPVFGVVAVGYGFGRISLFDYSGATAINRFVFYVALPLLLFHLVAQAPFQQFEWLLVVAFLCAEIVLYAAGYFVARHVFQMPWRESLLLGMSVAFANQVFFVLPIARQIYGETGALPVVAISTFDVLVLLGGTIVILDATRENSHQFSVTKISKIFLRNPPMLGIGAGIFANLAGVPVIGGLDLFTRFLGETAAPCSLFALGVILAAQKDETSLAAPATMTVLTLIGMPLVAWLLVHQIFQISPGWANPAMLVAAGPAGAMPFVLALQYQVPVASIARTIFISTAGSLLTVTLATQLS